MKLAWNSISVGVLLFMTASAYATQPNYSKTPGVLCTEQDPGFTGYRYKEKIPYCARNLAANEKALVAAAYGNIPQSEWPNYEFDHLIPLAAGGSNDIRNLWPQPIAEAHEKDKVETEVFRGLTAGTMTQLESVQKIRDWIAQH